MNRVAVLQNLLDRIPNPTYLEIGVLKGEVLHQLRAARKIAVDPEFRIPFPQRLRDRFSRSIIYRQMTSDRFFEHHGHILQDGIDVAFVDGLHTWEQAYRDVMNCLCHLNEGGVIVMHDCIPPNAAAALRATRPEEAQAMQHPEWTHEWTGDVYKAVIQLRSQRHDLQIFVLNCDYGLGIVTRGTAQETLSLDTDAIARMSYREFAADQDRLLNVKEPAFFSDWLQNPPSQETIAVPALLV
jgi:hypothetical protein